MLLVVNKMKVEFCQDTRKRKCQICNKNIAKKTLIIGERRSGKNQWGESTLIKLLKQGYKIKIGRVEDKIISYNPFSTNHEYIQKWNAKLLSDVLEKSRQRGLVMVYTMPLIRQRSFWVRLKYRLNFVRRIREKKMFKLMSENGEQDES